MTVIPFPQDRTPPAATICDAFDLALVEFIAWRHATEQVSFGLCKVEGGTDLGYPRMPMVLFDGAAKSIRSICDLALLVSGHPVPPWIQRTFELLVSEVGEPLLDEGATYAAAADFLAGAIEDVQQLQAEQPLPCTPRRGGIR